MTAWASSRLDELAGEGLDGYVFKKGSPTCGLFRVRVYNDKGMAERKGRGLFALLLIYPTARPLVGRPAALVATWALCLSPLHIHYSRFARAYALEMCLALLLLWSLSRLRSAHWKSTPLALLSITCFALLPWVHLASAGLVVGVALAAIALGWADSGRPSGALRPLALAALGALLCALLYVPVLEPLLAYLGKHTPADQARPSGVVGILSLLAGGRQAAWFLGLGVPLALVWLARERPASATLLGAATLGPVILLASTMPHGMEFAYARYLAVGVPLALVLVAWLVVRLASACGGERWGVALGLALVIAGQLAGPRGPWRPADRPFDNTALALAELLFGGDRFVTTINMSEFQEQHTVSRLVGSPPGYVGYGEGGVLTEAVRQRPYSIVLLDGITYFEFLAPALLATTAMMSGGQTSLWEVADGFIWSHRYVAMASTPL